jgi:adenylate cyclase class IV
MAGGAATSPQGPAETGTAPSKKGVEVEVKLRLPDAASHASVAQALIPCFRRTHEQENFFFDGADGELGAQRVVLRLRFYDRDGKAEITCKGRQELDGGVGRASEEEEDVKDPVAARLCLQDPGALFEMGSPLVARLKEQYGLKNGLRLLGGFDNLRSIYNWRGHTLELDTTAYPWGTVHELECETEEPEKVKAELEAFLKSLNVAYSYSTKSKFANFKDKTLL